ncbi:MAG: hypothetical protein AB1734_00505 [Elusimicrobiota bacterium]
MEKRFYFRLFLYTFIFVFAAGMAVTYAYARDLMASAFSSAFYALLFAVIIAGIFGGLHAKAVKKVPGWRDEDFASLRRERSFTMNVPYARAFDIALRFLAEQAGLVMEYNDREKFVAIARAPMTLNSLGITVKLEFREEGERTGVNLLVKPLTPFSMIDQGETLALASKIERGLSGTV